MRERNSDRNGIRGGGRPGVRAAGTALLLALLLAGAAAAAEHRGPRLQFGELRYDHGNVKQGETAVHVFEFHNTGDEVLEIHKVQTS